MTIIHSEMHQYQQCDHVVENGLHVSVTHGPNFIHAKAGNSIITGQHRANASCGHHLMRGATEVTWRVIALVRRAGTPHWRITLRFLWTWSNKHCMKNIEKQPKTIILRVDGRGTWKVTACGILNNKLNQVESWTVMCGHNGHKLFNHANVLS